MARNKNRALTKRPAAAPTPGPKVPAPVLLALILLATILAYLPAMRGDFLWDDDANVTSPELQPIGGLFRIWFEFGATQQYYPLLHTAFWFEHRLWGDWPPGFHLASLLWHLISVVLMYASLKRLKIPGPLLAAGIFALHPVMVESVAWITEQKNTLSTMLYLAAIYVYLQFDESRRKRQYLTSLALFVLALSAKTAIVTLPIALLVIFWWRRGTNSWRRDLLPLVPFFAAAGLAGAATCYVEWTHVGAVGADFEFTPVQRFLLAGRAVWFYLAKLVWPADLIFMYPRWHLDPTQWWQWIYPTAALAATAVLWRLRGRSRAPLAAWLFYCITLLPMLGLLNQYLFFFTFVSDHFQYVASLGMIALFSAAVTLALSRIGINLSFFRTAVPSLIIATLALLTWKQTHLYANGIKLYQATLDENPDCWMMHVNLGVKLLEADRPQEAIFQYRKAIDLKPDYYEGYNNLGMALAMTGKTQEGIDQLRKSVEMWPNSIAARRNLGNSLLKAGQFRAAIDELHAALSLKPNEPQTLNSLGGALWQSGQLPEAIERLQQAVRIKSDFVEARMNLAHALLKSGRVPEAIDELQNVLTLRPNDPTAIANLAAAYTAAGSMADAIALLKRALLAQPTGELHAQLAGMLAKTGQLNDAIDEYQAAVTAAPLRHDYLNNLGVALMNADRLPEAIQKFQLALDQDPNDAQAHTNLGNAMIQAGQYPRAIEELNHALRLQPKHAEAHDNLGVALEHSGQLPEAIAHFRQAVELEPGFANAQINLANVLVATGSAQEAIPHLQQAEKLLPDRADLQNRLGEVFAESNQFHEAIEHFQHAIKLDPKSALAYANLARAFASINNSKDAIAAAEKGIEVGRATDQSAAVGTIEEWLKHYQIELRREGP